MSKIKVAFMVIFACVLGVAIWLSSGGKNSEVAVIGGGSVQLNGIITSEKENFFKDERVKEIFKKNGLEVNYTRMASGKIAEAKTLADLNNADFVFPSGVQTSEKLKSTFKSSQAYNIFYSPMVIATWTPIEQILIANGLTKKMSGYEALDMEKLVKLSKSGMRWNQFAKSDAYPVNKGVLVSSSDSRFSNAAKMYISLSSYVLNGNNVVSSEADVLKVAPVIKQIVDAQGNRESSSTNMMSDYMSIGMGKVPMMFAYESEFLENAFKNKGLGKGMKLMYPTPTIFTKHVMVGMNEKALKLVDMFKDNAELKAVAAEYGFRFEGDSKIVEKATSVGVKIPEVMIDVVDSPSYDILDLMVKEVEQKR